MSSNIQRITSSRAQTACFCCVCKTAKSDHELHYFCMSIYSSVGPHGTTRLPLDRFREIWYL